MKDKKKDLSKGLKDEGKQGGHIAVLGKRSPMWALNGKMLIPCHDGSDYLFRRRLIATPWFGVYIHDIFREDKDYDPHDHPWTFRSWILRGSYTERYYPTPHVDLSNFEYRTWKRWSWHKMGRSSAHRIVEADPKLKTLVIVGKRKGNWGFFTKPWGGWVAWEDYVAGRPGRDHTLPPVNEMNRQAPIKVKPRSPLRKGSL